MSAEESKIPVSRKELNLLNLHGIAQEKLGRRLIWQWEIELLQKNSKVQFLNEFAALTNLFRVYGEAHKHGYLWCGIDNLLVFVDKILDDEIPYIECSMQSKNMREILLQERRNNGL